MILITRPLEEGQKLVEMLERQNFECLLEPMINIEYVKPDWQEHLDGKIQSFLATSKNGKKYFPTGYKLATIPEQGRNAKELLQWLGENLQPENGKLVYLRGDVISLDIAAELRKHGFEVKEITVYHSQAPQDFSENFLWNFDKIDLATFFSTRSLQNFLALAGLRKLKKKLKDLRILCMSHEITDAARNHKFKEIFVADEPNLNSMLDKIDEIY